MGRETEIGKIWGMIKRMNGIKREYGDPVLIKNENAAVTDEEKADMLAQNFVHVHSSSNISDEGWGGREATIDENEQLLLPEAHAHDLIHVSFTKAELNGALKKTMISSSKDILLELYNTVWGGRENYHKFGKKLL